MVQCPDQPGIVALVSGFLHKHGGNIIHADQHSSRTTGTFFMRVEYDLEGLTSQPLHIEKAFSECGMPDGTEYRFTYPMRPPKVAILCSNTDHCLRELLWRAKETQELPCEVPLVISNHDKLSHVADSHGVPFHHLPMTKATKPEQEAAMRDLIKENNIDLIVLARYMQILSPELCADYSGRIINIHHSFLPAFIGGDPYGQAHKRGVKIIGATAHFVTSDLDEGPIICQDVAHISHRESRKELIGIGREVERRVLFNAVRSWCDDRVFIDGDENKTVVM